MIDINKEKMLNVLKKQKEYFYKGETKKFDFRIKQLEKLKKAIKENEKLIEEALYKDLHKSEFEAYATEIGYIYDSIGYFIKNLRKWVKVRKIRTPIIHFGSKSYIYAEPYGSVLIVGPFNYPFQLVIEPLIGAISAGNCAVIKPSEYTTNVSNIVYKILKENFNEEYIQVIEGGKEETSVLINSPFDYIFFTGSVAVGKIVMEAAAKNLIPVTLELGGKSPTIVHKDANIEVAAERIVWGKFMNVGQTCVAPDYMFVHKKIKEELILKIIEKIKKFYGGDPKVSSNYGRIVNEKQLSRIVGLMDKDKIIFGGEYDINELYIAPTIMDNLTWKDKIMREEIFGPVLPVLEYEELDEVINRINSRAKPLALYLFTESRDVENKITRNVSYGGGCINDTMTHLASPFLPFGGVGSAGIGSYHGEMSFKTLSHMKSILKKSTYINLKFIFPPYTKKKMAMLRKVMR